MEDIKKTEKFRRAKLTYFKPSGKWYATTHYKVNQTVWHNIIEEIKKLKEQRKLPGLMEGHSDFYVLIDLKEGFDYLVPYLLALDNEEEYNE